MTDLAVLWMAGVKLLAIWWPLILFVFLCILWDLKILIVIQGATAFEIQAGPAWLKIVHLRGGGWTGSFFSRVSWGYDRNWQLN